AVHPAARPFADAFQSVVGPQADDDAQEPRLVHAMMIEQWRVGTGHGRDDHLGYAHTLTLPSRWRRSWIVYSSLLARSAGAWPWRRGGLARTPCAPGLAATCWSSFKRGCRTSCTTLWRSSG